MPARLSEASGTAARRLPAAVLALLMALAAAVLAHEGRGLTFFADEWNFILTRHGDGVDDLLDAHVQHFSLVPVLIYRGLFELVGIDDYAPYRAVTIGLHLLCVGLLYALVRERLGAWAALVAVIPVLFLGRAHEDLIWAFQMGFLAAIAAGLGALLALRRRTRGGDVAAALLLCAALASSGTGIPFFAVAVVEVVLSRGRRSAWIVLVPLAAYLLWYAGYGEPSAERANVPDAPSFGATLIVTAAGALIGLGAEFGRMAALLGALAVARAMALSREVRARVLPPLAGLLVFAASTGLARADNEDPGASRYLYPAAILIVLVAAGALAGRALPARALALAGVVASVAALTNLTPLQEGAEARRVSADALLTRLGAIEIARDSVDPGFMAEPAIDARGYLEAVDRWGSPAYSPAELAARPEGVRAGADAALLAALPLRSESAPAARGCTEPAPPAPGAPVDVPLPPDGLTLVPRGGGPVEVRVRMFAELFPNGPTVTVEGGPRRLVLPAGRGRPPAQVRITPGDAVGLCAS